MFDIRLICWLNCLELTTKVKTSFLHFYQTWRLHYNTRWRLILDTFSRWCWLDGALLESLGQSEKVWSFSTNQRCSFRGKIYWDTCGSVKRVCIRTVYIRNKIFARDRFVEATWKWHSFYLFWHFLSSSIKIQSSNNFGRNKESTRFAECIKKYCLKKYHIFAQNDFFRPETLVLGHKHFKTNAGLCYPRSSLVNQFQATFLQLSF